MEHTYKINGMTCNSCVETVKTALKSINGIENVQVTLNPAHAVIAMKHHIQTSDMSKILLEHGNYSLEETNVSGSVSAQTQAAEKSFFAVYKPVFRQTAISTKSLRC